MWRAHPTTVLDNSIAVSQSKNEKSPGSLPRMAWFSYKFIEFKWKSKRSWTKLQRRLVSFSPSILRVDALSLVYYLLCCCVRTPVQPLVLLSKSNFKRFRKQQQWSALPFSLHCWLRLSRLCQASEAVPYLSPLKRWIGEMPWDWRLPGWLLVRFLRMPVHPIQVRIEHGGQASSADAGWSSLRGLPALFVSVLLLPTKCSRLLSSFYLLPQNHVQCLQLWKHLKEGTGRLKSFTV